MLYVGTFSKVLAPSLRLGFLVLPASLVPAATNLRRLVDTQPPALVQHAMRRFIGDGHLERHLRRSRRAYRARHELVRAFVDEQARLGRLSPVAADHAGLHVAAHLPTGVREQLAEQRQLRVGERVEDAVVGLRDLVELQAHDAPPPAPRRARERIVGMGTGSGAGAATVAGCGAIMPCAARRSQRSASCP